MNHNLKLLYMKYNYFPTIHTLRNKNLYINPLVSPDKCIFTLTLKEKSLSSLYPKEGQRAIITSFGLNIGR